MNILFVDDELENNLAEVYKSVQDFFANRGDKVIKKLSGPQALHFLDTDDNALDVDIAILDQAITDDMTGQELGAVINDRFPHIALVMLTGRGDWQTKFELCQQLMRIGFCDFIDKASFKSAQIFSHLERIVNLPSVQAKQKLKLRLTNIEDYLRHLGGEINQAKKIHFLENFDDLVVKPGKLEEILANLDAQEEILAFSEAKKITVNRACLGAGIFLHTTGVPITKKLLNELKFLANYTNTEYSGLNLLKDGKPIRFDSRYSVFFQLKTKRGKRFDSIVVERFNEVALIVMALLNKDPDRWPVTIERARRSHQRGSDCFTFVNEIIEELDRNSKAN